MCLEARRNNQTHKLGFSKWIKSAKKGLNSVYVKEIHVCKGWGQRVHDTDI